MFGTNKNTKGRVEVTAMAASGTVLLPFNERMRRPFIVVDACGYERQRLVSALKEMPQVRARKRCSPFFAGYRAVLPEIAKSSNIYWYACRRLPGKCQLCCRN